MHPHLSSVYPHIAFLCSSFPLLPNRGASAFPTPVSSSHCTHPRHQRFSWPDTPGARRAQLSRKPPSRSAFALRTSGSLQHSSSALGPQLHRARASLGECKHSYVQHHCYLPSLPRLLVFSLLSGSSRHCAVRHRPAGVSFRLQLQGSRLEARAARWLVGSI